MPPPTPRTAPRFVGAGRSLVLTLWLAGCAVGPLTSYEPDAIVTANLPVGRIGVRDQRIAFAGLFARELRMARRRDGRPEEPPDAIEQWLHGVGPVTAAEGAATETTLRRFLERRAGTSVLIVPGLFGDCLADQSVPFGDGVLRTMATEPVQAYDQYADLGLHSIRMVPLPGRASSQHNGALLAEAIRAEAARPGVERIVLVAYSKGVADALRALATLESEAGLPRQLVALVSVAGVVMGTPLADRFEHLYAAVSRGFSPLNCTDSQGDELRSVTRRERSAWLAQHAPPPQLSYFSIVAYADDEETASLLRPGRRALAAVDPRNDGQVIAGDAVLPTSELLATARSDHWDIALPRDRHPDALLRSFGSGRAYPREALFRALVMWVLAGSP